MAEDTVHEPCAFNPKGAGKEFCTRMTSVLHHNRNGCCGSNCASPFRVCWKCITTSASPNLCSNPITGLCALHGAPDGAKQLSKEPLMRARPLRTAQEPSIWEPEPAEKQRRILVAKAPAPDSPKRQRVSKQTTRVSKPRPAGKKRQVPPGFKRHTSVEVLEYIFKSFKRDAAEMESLAELVESERTKLMSERELTDEMRKEIRERTAILKVRLEALLATLIPT